ncbi:energy transducer TonB [Tenacibaculum sp. UWU-22]|uniref:energy transducer TonB n=1 Tax=Tenacibaculum sp. UWU-22 TaxID=3234187 RepID=UPI0034DB4A95
MMGILDTKYKRKSAIITTIILLLLLVAIFQFGMKYLDPPEEYGLAINLGNFTVGSGEPIEKTKMEPKPQNQQKAEEKPVQQTPKKIVDEKIITSSTSKEVPVIEKTKTPSATPVSEKITEPVVKEKPKPQKPSKETQDALNKLLNGNTSDGQPQGEGDDEQLGVKGNENGDPNTNKYYGNARDGLGGNYNLSGRKAVSKPIEKPDCQEEGTVVVSIEVNKDGQVVKATPGVKGSTNTAPCLLKPAKAAALKTKWNADSDAPIKQKGTIIYRFSLSK